MSALRYWVTQLAGLRGYFWQALGVSMVINALMVMPSLYMLQIYDRVMVSQSGLTLLTLTGLLALSLLAAAWLEQRRTAILVRMGQALDDRLGVAAHDAALLKQWQRPSNSPLQPVQDLNALRQFVTGQGLFVLFDLPWFPIYLVIMFLLHPWLGVLGLVFSGVLLCIAVLSHRRSRAAIELGSDTARQAQQDQMTKLRNAELIHAMGMLPAVRQRWSERHAVYSSVQARAEATSAGFSSLSKMARYVQQSLSLGAGAWLVIEGQISPGAMIAANLLMTKALQPLDLLVSSWSGLLTARLAAERLRDALPGQGLEHRQEIRALQQPQVRWQDVSVRLDDGRTLLHEVSLQLEPGSVVALVGPSGSGKTTLARTLMGLWPAHLCSGRAELDGLSVFDWDRQSLGPALGYLAQEPALMEGTLAQNIARFGKPDAVQVVDAARRAGIHELILALPQGYDTQAGEAGQTLSGGQRQLIALAQALYGSPRLVVLDEPNSNLDEAGERCLLQALQVLRQQGCAVLIITHRPEILQSVDHTWQMRQGRLIGPERQSPSPETSTRLAHESA
jgi:ATP-binding cassette subfamily C exporter for protease/lipase